MPEETEKQGFAWNSSLLSYDKDYQEFLKLADVLMKSSSIEEFKIYRDLMLSQTSSLNEDD
jgi:hypothetical protein